MARTIAQHDTRIAALITGIDLNDVSDKDGAYSQAARDFVQRAKPPEAVGRFPLSIYSGVFDYPVNTEDAAALFDSKLVDLRPQGVSRGYQDFASGQIIQDFDRTKAYGTLGYRFAIEYVNGVPILRIAAKRPFQQLFIDQMNQVGNWKVGGTASTLAQDITDYYAIPGSLRFNLAAGANPSQGYIEETLSFPVDLSAYQNASMVFLAVQLPSGTDISSIAIRIGTNATNYFEVSGTQAFVYGNFIAGNWFLIGVPIAPATTVGTVNYKSIQYARVTCNYNGTAQFNVRMGGLWVALPNPVEVLYQTAGVFLSKTTGLLSQTIDSQEDTIILNDAAYNLFLYECAIQILLQSGGSLGTGLVGNYQAKLNGARTRTGAIIELGLYDLYRADNPTQELNNLGNWYDE